LDGLAQVTVQLAVGSVTGVDTAAEPSTVNAVGGGVVHPGGNDRVSETRTATGPCGPLLWTTGVLVTGNGTPAPTLGGAVIPTLLSFRSALALITTVTGGLVKQSLPGVGSVSGARTLRQFVTLKMCDEASVQVTVKSSLTIVGVEAGRTVVAGFAGAGTTEQSGGAAMEGVIETVTGSPGPLLCRTLLTDSPKGTPAPDEGGAPTLWEVILASAETASVSSAPDRKKAATLTNVASSSEPKDLLNQWYPMA
jgi:hypothetical protein